MVFHERFARAPSQLCLRVEQHFEDAAIFIELEQHAGSASASPDFAGYCWNRRSGMTLQFYSLGRPFRFRRVSSAFCATVFTVDMGGIEDENCLRADAACPFFPYKRQAIVMRAAFTRHRNRLTSEVSKCNFPGSMTYVLHTWLAEGENSWPPFWSVWA